MKLGRIGLPPCEEGSCAPISSCSMKGESAFPRLSRIDGSAHQRPNELHNSFSLMNAHHSSFGSVLVAICFVAAAHAGELRITSPSFKNGASVLSRFSREGGNSSPPLRIESPPANAKSLVLIVDDPDAPGGLFTHWLVWNIDPKTSTIAERNTPKGATEGTNDFGEVGYGGPQPPSGTHRYYFKIFALDKQLDLPAGAKRRDLDKAMKGHVIAQGQLLGRYSAK
jgi:Raf kinase inhibitor-like YbhB/YbcL family protein